MGPMRRCLAILLLCLLAGGGALASPGGFFGYVAAPAAIRASMGGLFIFNLDEGSGITTTHLITNDAGLGLEYRLGQRNLLSFEPGLDLYGHYYLAGGGRALPTDITNREAYVIGLLVDLPIVLNLDLGESSRLSLGLGPAFDLRLGIAAIDSDDSSVADLDADMATINSYFWSMGRYFTPTTFLRYRYRAKEKLAIDFTAKAYWPVFNLWAGEGLSFFDQMILSASISAVFLR